jgi:site-specific DNA recombinase
MPRRPLAAVPDTPGRVVLYVRVSALMGRGGDDFHSPDVQASAMRRVAVGMKEVAVVEDIDRTGRHFAREGIEQIRRMALARQMDALAVYDVSRLGRNVRESLTFLAWLADQGVTILSACEQVDTSTPAGRLMLTNMLAIAEYRSDEIGRGWSAAIARRAEQGRHHGRPLGYTREGKRLIPDPMLGPVIAKAWRDYSAGVPIGEITRNVAAARGKAMIAANVKVLFRRPVYLGHATAAGQVVARDAHEPLVDQDTWDRVQLRLARDSKTPARHLEVTWALVGLAYCPHGHRLQRQPHRASSGELVNRLCCGMGPSRGVAGGCEGIGFPVMRLVEEKVLADVRDYIRRLRTDDAARVELLARQHTTAVDAKTHRQRLRRVQDAIAKMSKAWALGDLTADEYAPVAELKAEAETIRARLAELDDGTDQPTPEQAATAAEALLDVWPDATVAERNRMLRVVVDQVVVRRAARWREPVGDCVDVLFR